MSKTIELDNSKLPPAMAAYGQRERVAEIIYDWIHENQVTHRRKWEDRSDEDKAQYRKVATSIMSVVDSPTANLQVEVAELRKAAAAALTNIQGMLKGDDLPSMVIRDMLKAALKKVE